MEVNRPAGPNRPRFNTTPVAPAPTGGPRHDPKGPPLRHGQTYISDDAKGQLKMVGWEEGDEVPKDLPHVIATIAEKYGIAKAEVDAVGGRKRLGAVKTVRIEDLPPAARQEITDFVKQAAQAAAENAARMSRREAAIPPNASPEVRKALEDVADREEAARAAVVINDTDALPTAAATTAEPAAPAVPAEHTPLHTNCPRCHFDLSQTEVFPVTDADRANYMAAMLDPTKQARFEKMVNFFGDKLVIIFRTLTAKEAAHCRAQIKLDAAAGKFGSEAEIYMQLMEYRMVMSISKVLRENDIDTIELDPVAAPYQPTLLAEMCEFMDTQVYPSEHLKNMIGRKFHNFGRLVVALEAEAESPDF